MPQFPQNPISPKGVAMLFDVPWNVLALQLFFGLALGAVYVLLASGLSIIYGLLDVVNFAHGTFAMLGAYAVYVAVSLSGSFWVGIVSAIVIIGLIGWRHRVDLPPASLSERTPSSPALHVRHVDGHP